MRFGQMRSRKQIGQIRIFLAKCGFGQMWFGQMRSWPCGVQRWSWTVLSETKLDWDNMWAEDDTHKSRSAVQSDSIIPCAWTCVTRILQPFFERKTRVYVVTTLFHPPSSPSPLPFFFSLLPFFFLRLFFIIFSFIFLFFFHLLLFSSTLLFWKPSFFHRKFVMKFLRCQSVFFVHSFNGCDSSFRVHRGFHTFQLQLLHSDRQSSCGCFGSRSTPCVVKTRHGSGALWFRKQRLIGETWLEHKYWNTCIEADVFCGGRLALAEEGVVASHSFFREFFESLRWYEFLLKWWARCKDNIMLWIKRSRGWLQKICSSEKIAHQSWRRLRLQMDKHDQTNDKVCSTSKALGNRQRSKENLRDTEWLRKTTRFLIAACGSAFRPVVEWVEDQDNVITNEAFDRQFCKYSQFQHLTECARQHISPTTSKTHDFKAAPATAGALHWCHPPRYTDARKGRPWEAQDHHNSTTTLRHLHDTAARLSNTCMAVEPVRWNRRSTTQRQSLTTRSSTSLSREPKRSETDRKSRKRSSKRFRRRTPRSTPTTCSK